MVFANYSFQVHTLNKIFFSTVTSECISFIEMLFKCNTFNETKFLNTIKCLVYYQDLFILNSVTSFTMNFLVLSLNHDCDYLFFASFYQSAMRSGTHSAFDLSAKA